MRVLLGSGLERLREWKREGVEFVPLGSSGGGDVALVLADGRGVEDLSRAVAPIAPT